jgi:hypothetical protein
MVGVWIEPVTAQVMMTLRLGLDAMLNSWVKGGNPVRWRKTGVYRVECLVISLR